MAACAGGFAAAGGRVWRRRLASTHGGQHRGQGAPERGGRKGGQHHEALGRSQGGFGTKIHLKCDGQGRPLAFVLTPGQRHEMPVLEALLD